MAELRGDHASYAEALEALRQRRDSRTPSICYNHLLKNLFRLRGNTLLPDQDKLQIGNGCSDANGERPTASNNRMSAFRLMRLVVLPAYQGFYPPFAKFNHFCPRNSHAREGEQPSFCAMPFDANNIKDLRRTSRRRTKAERYQCVNMPRASRSRATAT